VRLGGAVFFVRPGPNPSSADAVRYAAEAAGLRLLRRSFTRPQTWQRTPTEAAVRFDQRVYSSLVDIDDDRWRAEIAPLIERMRSLPEPDRPRVMCHRQPVLEFAPF
jgi:hypothetical protein